MGTWYSSIATLQRVILEDKNKAKVGYIQHVKKSANVNWNYCQPPRYTMFSTSLMTSSPLD